MDSDGRGRGEVGRIVIAIGIVIGIGSDSGTGNGIVIVIGTVTVRVIVRERDVGSYLLSGGRGGLRDKYSPYQSFLGAALCICAEVYKYGVDSREAGKSKKQNL